MGKQHHDQGFKKKKQPPKNPEALSRTDALALDLVKRGLASELILDRRFPPANNSKDRP